MWVPDLSSFQLVSNLPVYGTFIFLSALVCLAFAYLALLRETGPLKAFGLSVTEFLLGGVLAVAFAKGVYFLIRLEYLTKMDGIGQFFSSLKLDELSFFGGVAGVILAVWLSAKITRQGSPGFTSNGIGMNTGTSESTG